MLYWSEDLIIDLANIDEQHKEIFARIHKLFEACSEDRAKEEIGSLIDFLKSYTQEHFCDEEALQIESNYPAHKEHQQEHIAFIRDIESLKAKFETHQDQSHILEMAGLLSEWLANHICKVDKAFGLYYRDCIKK